MTTKVLLTLLVREDNGTGESSESIQYNYLLHTYYLL